MLAKQNQKFLSIKKAQQEIEKATYYQEHHFPELFDNKYENLCIIYYNLKVKSSTQLLWNKSIVEQCARKAYLSNFQTSKIGDSLYKRIVSAKIPYMFITGTADQIFDFHVRENDGASHEMQKEKTKKLQLFIIHYCNSDNQNCIKWLHFIERYTFDSESFQYSMVASIKAEESILSRNQRLFEEYLKQINLIENPKKVEGLLLQYQIQLKNQIQKQNDPAFSAEHRVLNRIKPQNIKIYTSLQKQFPDQSQNLICRYLIAKQYKINETRQALKQYIAWREDLVSKWKYQDFKEFEGIFTYLGEDRMGRPVILNKANRVKVNEIDVQKYKIFYIYYLQIYIPSKMRGNVTQIMIIADVQGIGVSNFKLAITRKNLEDNVKYSPERQYKIIGINVSNFALYWWRVVSPLIPKRSLSKIEIAGSEKQAIFRILQEEMDGSIIPDYLGGSKVD